MLRNAVLHLANEQPLLADLFEMPTSGDVTVRLTNLRTLDGKRPIFVDDLKSVFVFPYHRVTFTFIGGVLLHIRRCTSMCVAGSGIGFCVRTVSHTPRNPGATPSLTGTR